MKELRKPSNLDLRDRIRHELFPALQSSLGKLSPFVSPETNLIAEADKVIETVEKSLAPHGKADKSLDIVFLTMIGGHKYLFATEVLLSLILRNRGHRVRLVVCDQALPACEIKKSTNRSSWQRSCAKCWSLGRHLHSSYGLDVVPVSSLFSEPESKGDSGVLKATVEASLLKHFMVGSLDVIDEGDLSAREEAYYESAHKSLAIGSAIAEWKPDRVLMSHGIYSTWGPARELLLEKGVSVATYGKGKKKQTIKFNWNTSADWWDVAEEWKECSDTPLTKSQQKQIDDYLASRRDHKKDSLVYNFGVEQSAEQTKKRLGLDPSKLTFTLFTNVLWDAASAQREIAFANPIEWVLETIGWFKNHPKRQLILKIHPAEVVIGTKQPFADIIRAQFPELPENVRLLEPHEEVNSWSIINVTDLGLVHTSTVGMELPLEGVPVAVVSKTHFRDRGFTIDVASKQEYFELLEGFSKDHFDIDSLREKAKRYAFLLFERYQLPFPFFEEPNHADVRSFCFSELERIGTSDFAKSFLPTFERGSGSFLLAAGGETGS